MAQLNKPPQHKNPSRADRTAVAPYNFVPITDRLIAFSEDNNPLLTPHDQYDTQRLTGWIDVELETKSPIYVRAPLTLDEFAQAEKGKQDKSTLDDAKPDFFYTDDPDAPEIPGSSLRGMLRSIVEILGHGKLAPVSDDPLIYRAVGDTTSHGDAYRDQLFDSDSTKKHHYTPKFKGGYIRERDGNYFIQPAKEINGTTFGRINHKRIPNNLNRWGNGRSANEIYVEVGDYDFKQIRGGFIHMKRAIIVRAAENAAPGLNKAALVRSGHMFSKKTEAVIFDMDGAVAPDQWIRIPDGSQGDERDLVAAYKDQQSPEQKRLLGDKGVLVDKHPVFYLMQGDKLEFFGHTQMFRAPYRRSPQQMLPHEHADEGRMDFAETMFGRVKRQRGDNQRNQATAGRVFVEDARMLAGQSSPWLPGKPIVIPNILGTPNPTTFQHYLTQSNPDEKSQLSSYNASPRETTLRGHKLYWHKGNVSHAEFEADPENVKGKEKVHTRIKPVRAGVKFGFRVRFENLALAELGLLWWSLALPVKGTYHHKIGMGKPLGLGSIHLKPTLSLIDPEKRYKTLFVGDEFELGLLSAEITKQYRDSALQNFEKYICDRLDYRSFAEAPRIQQFLTMLSWPEPQPHQVKTRYMEIERPDQNAKRGKRNEYRERPVLPLPLAVNGSAESHKTTQSRVPTPQRSPKVASQSGEKTGTVKTFKGRFGFIVRDDNRRDIFFHISELRGTESVQVGDRVVFTIGEGRDKGEAAKDVRLSE